MSINFDRAVSYYDATRGYPPEVAKAIGMAIVEAAEATPSTRFLEVGVGTGRIALPVIALGYDYTGIDISLGMMDRLREKLADLERETGQPPRATLVEADMQSLPFPDERFDAVIATHVFHLVADPWRAWQEALRVLRPGGALLVCADAAVGNEPVTVNEAWRAIVREAYGPVPNSSESATRLLREQEKRDPTLHIDELRPVQWEFTTTVAEDLDAIRRRLWSNTWVLPDAVFEQCLTKLAAWCDEHFAGRTDEPLPRRSEFVIRRVRRGPVK